MVAAISLNASSGNVGDTTIVTGTGFATTSAVTFTYGGITIVPSDAPITTDGGGGFTAHIVIPASVKGAHAIVATDASLGTATANFTVAQKITVTGSPQRIGGSVTVIGTGFATISLTAITIGGVTVTPVTTDINGSFSQAETVPTLASGTRSISATDAATNNATVNMTVTAPTLARDVSHGPLGTVVTLTGANYIPSHSLTITNIDGTTTMATADSSGNIPAATKITTGPNVQGSHNITVSDGTNTGTVTFTTDTSMSISPTSGKVGDTITITGEGFANASAVTSTLAGSGVTTAPSSPSPSSAGHFTATFVIPAAVEGNNTVSCTDAADNNATAVLVVNPNLVLDPTHGPAGELITLKGTGFATLSASTVTFDGVAITPTSAITTDATGGFTNSITPVRSIALGTHTIAVTDAGGNVASAVYTVDELSDTTVTVVNPGKIYMPFGTVDEAIQLGGVNTYSVVAMIPVYNFTDAQLQLYNEDGSNTLTYTAYGHTNYNEGKSPDPTLTSWKVIGSADQDIAPHANALVTMTKPALWSWIMIQAKPKTSNDDAVLDIWGRLVKAVGQ